MKYIKDSPRLNVQYINADTEDIILEVKNKNWMNVGELFADHYVNEILKQNNIETPENLMILVVGEYTLVE